MFVATISLSSFESIAQETIRTLTELRQSFGTRGLKGFVQSYLLRDSRGGALFITIWQSRNDMLSFMASEEGKQIQEKLGSLFQAGDPKFEQYRATWIGVKPSDIAPEALLTG